MARRHFDSDEVFRENSNTTTRPRTRGLHRILGQQYHAVVGNPPYITVKDRPSTSPIARAMPLAA